jgi:mannose-6-phosphate isomerase-like protein (cupin superfamily)
MILHGITDEHTWGETQTLYRTDSVWLVRFVGVAGRKSSFHQHQRMANHFYLIRGELLVSMAPRASLLRAGESLAVPAGVPHQLIFVKDSEGFEAYFGRIDAADISRLEAHVE